MLGQCRTPLPRSEPASTLDVFTLQERIGHGPQVARSTQCHAATGEDLCVSCGLVDIAMNRSYSAMRCYEHLNTFDRCV